MITCVERWQTGVELAAPRWRWRRLEPSAGHPMWQTAAPGQLGADGATIFVRRFGTETEACPRCGRQADLWHAYLHLPLPWRMLGPVGLGCSREHATAGIPADCSWAYVADVFSRAAQEIRAGSRMTVWDETRARWCDRRAERAIWLAGMPDQVRRLALRMWASGNGRLSVADMAVVTTAIFCAPAQCTPPAHGLPPPATTANEPSPATDRGLA
jgi:hypothetical protein